MASRIELQSKLEELLGNENVYYQPPESVKMEYPAIKYSISKRDKKYANNAVYSSSKKYEVIVIDRRPDSPVIDKIMDLPYCSHDRHYIADNLNHDSFTLYF